MPILEAAASTYPSDFDILFQLTKVWRMTGRTAQADAQAAKLAELDQLIAEFSALNKQAFSDLDIAELRCQLGRLALRAIGPNLPDPGFRRLWRLIHNTRKQ